jgi:hypothetical protein
MQPESMKPAAKIPNVTFSDDMVWFQSKQYRASLSIVPKALDSIDPIIVEICHNSSAEGLLPRCEARPVAFLPQVLRRWAYFAAKETELSIPCHSCATQRPQMQTPR